MRKDGTNGRGEYRTMLVSDFAARPSRQIHELVSGILLGVESLADDSALIVALDGAGAMSIASLRSAINRATKSRKIPIGTFSDEKNFAFGRNLR
jgi:hypothetical protein